MHRQSLGSPAAKLHANGVITVKESSSSPSSSPLSPSLLSSELQKKLSNNDEDEMSPKKSHKTTPSRHHEKLIHLIPILTLLCIFVLYLFSHNPSQNDLAQFNVFKTLSKPSDSTKMEEINRVLEIGKGDILAIRSARNLQGLNRERESSKSRINRKIGDF